MYNISVNKKGGLPYSEYDNPARSENGTPIQPDNRRPRDIITHLFGFCKRFSVDRLFRDGIFLKFSVFGTFGTVSGADFFVFRISDRIKSA